jgi:hypothetical protein
VDGQESSQPVVLDEVRCCDCGARIDDDARPEPGLAPAHRHRWDYAGSTAAPAPTRARRGLRMPWYRRFEWWLNCTGSADVHRSGTSVLLHPPEQRCWSSYCSHCGSPDG